jgi:hypothetical protein
MNEGCINCGTEEDYNGADNPAIRYLCTMCTVFGLAKQEAIIKEFEEVERQIKQSKKPRLRLSKKREQRKNRTLSSC